ncbi:GGDEF domain-containing protein [Candidatus Finniella inopinata]|uniref:Diguanylate cyclase n=1 Tax=Candidatus Finniella inopinata TaxID=1696036 RepID=A0A4Q7DIG2_9PROT|nr:GGDEF domain-containing protein [Candidatus Finniella inopinata]RZI46492.1 diguanylate cyclase [Candidatus Finniella inopinata]
MQFADAFHFSVSQQDKLNSDLAKLHVVFISHNSHIELCDDVGLFCKIITLHDFENLIEINRFRKIDAICLDYDSLGTKTFDFLRKRSYQKSLASIPVILTTQNADTTLEVFTDGGIQDYYVGCLKNRLFALRFKNFIELHCLRKTEPKDEPVEQFDLAFMAYYDKLTNLPNRLLFQERVEDKIRQNVYNPLDFALLFLDLDGFKLINDENNHKTGDWLLGQVAIRLKNCLKKEDTVARLGGDEFGILLDQVKNQETVEKIAHRILYRLSTPYSYNGDSLKIHVSIGIAVFPQNGQTYECLVHKADQAMYAAKKNGKGQFVFAGQ